MLFYNSVDRGKSQAGPPPQFPGGKKGSKIRSRTSAVMPAPVSATDNMTYLSKMTVS